MLYENALSYYAKSGDKRAGQEPRQEIRITAESEVSDFPDRKRILAFRVVTGNKFLVVSATNDEEFKRWKQDISDRIEALKRMASEQSTGSRKGTNQMQVVSAAGQDFEMNSRYEMIRPIGHGAYGVVISALDHELNLKVAIKKIPNTFEDLVDAKRIVREIRLLRHFDHDNVIRVVNLFTPQPHTHFDDVYIVSDLMETDLHRVIYSRQRLTPEHIQFFLYQMLCGLKYIHSANVLHRDLKPSNILLNAVRPAPVASPSLACSRWHAHACHTHAVSAPGAAPPSLLALGLCPTPHHRTAISSSATLVCHGGH